MSNVLVIDIGTQSIRGIIFDDKGNLLVKEQIKYKPYMSKKNGYVEASAEMYWQNLCQITNALREKCPDLLDSVLAMSVDTFRDTAVLWDKDNNVLRDCILWSDQRDSETKSKLPNGAIFKLVGMYGAVNSIRSKTKTRWIKENEPEIWAKVAKITHISGYINYKLTGNFVDCYASQTGHLPFDNKKKRWFTTKDLLFPMIEVPLSMMIPLCSPGDVMGEIDESVAKETGLPIGLKVIASGSDKNCETLGVGCYKENVASISFGTSSTVQFSTKKFFEPEPFLPAYPSVIKDHYNPEVQIFRGYWMISWFKDNFAKHLEAKALEQGRSIEEVMNDEIKAVPAGCEGLVLQPFWQAGITTPEARGSIIGFSDFHTRAHVYRAIIEGIDFALKEGLERMAKRGHKKIDYIAVAGGGSQSDIICQIAADVFNLPVKRVQTYETSALGAAIVTFTACGVYKDIPTAAEQMVRYTDLFTPNEENVKIYDYVYNKVYLKLYKKLQKLYKQIDKEKCL